MENHLKLVRNENNYLLHFRVALSNYERLVLDERNRRGARKLKRVKRKFNDT